MSTVAAVYIAKCGGYRISKVSGTLLCQQSNWKEVWRERMEKVKSHKEETEVVC